LVWSLTGIVAVVGLVVGIGWFLPVGHEAARSAHFEQSPTRVYDMVADIPGYANWLTDTTRVEVVEAVAPTRVVTRVADPNQPFGGTWTFEITPDGSGSQLTITERGEVYNPAFRFMARFVFGYTATMEGYLDDLRKKLGS
jgi:hypothetical protein